MDAQNKADLGRESLVIRTHLLELLRNLKFGQITIVIKNGKITQIETTEKQRTNWKGLYGEGI